VHYCLFMSNTTKQAKFKNGKWAHVASGRVYYARLRADGVWLYSGERPSFIGYCGVQPLDRFLADFRKV
jgi:hypothetical protein